MDPHFVGGRVMRGVSGRVTRVCRYLGTVIVVLSLFVRCSGGEPLYLPNGDRTPLKNWLGEEVGMRTQTRIVRMRNNIRRRKVGRLYGCNGLVCSRSKTG